MIRRAVWMMAGLVMGISLSMTVGVLAQDMPACEGEYLESVRELGTIYVHALNTANLDLWYDVLADDFVTYGSNASVVIDKATSRANAEGLFVTFPGFQTEIHLSTVSADCRFVTYYWTSSGTFSGPLGNIPPTGLSGAVSGINIAEVEDGKILRTWNAYDQVTLLSAMGIMGPNAPAPGGLTEAVAANFVERFDAFFNTPDFEIADEIFAENFQSHLPLAPQLDRQGFKDYVASFYVPFPDIRQTTNKVLISGDHLIVHVTYTGTSEGAFFGVEPTGGQWAMNGIGIFKFENGLAVENWAVIDLGELFLQTGVVVPPAP